MYRLRADVRIAPAVCSRIWLEGRPETAYRNPGPALAGAGASRLSGVGRQNLTGVLAITDTEMNRLRVENAVPETGIELIADETYILEAGFERLHGVSFRKGCYVGQEVTARMKHKTELRKGLVRVRVAGPVPAAGTAVLSDGTEIGTLQSCEGDYGLAYLRLDRANGVLTAAEPDCRSTRSVPPDFLAEFGSNTSGLEAMTPPPSSMSPPGRNASKKPPASRTSRMPAAMSHGLARELPVAVEPAGGDIGEVERRGAVRRMPAEIGQRPPSGQGRRDRCRRRTGCRSRRHLARSPCGPRPACGGRSEAPAPFSATNISSLIGS